jgi:hypothetical protein
MSESRHCCTAVVISKVPRFLLIGLLLSLCVNTRAELVTDSQIGKLNVIKLLANLARFVSWPENTFSSADAPFRYCIAGQDDIGTLLDEALGGASANGRGYSVIRFGLDQIDKLTQCHLVFIGVEGIDQATGIFDAVGNSSTITVGQVEGFTDKGGMVQFIGNDRNVTLRLNKDKLDATPLVVSSKLYSASQH